jgi:putative ABC transport system permease protein
VRLATYLSWMRRESRGSAGRLLFFIGCLGVGVAAVVSVAGLSASLDRAIRTEARELLAADLAIGSRRPPGDELDEVLRRLPGARELRRADVQEMATVVLSPEGRSQLVELKVVDGPYPFYGELTLESPGDGTLAELLTDDAVVVAPDLLTRLGLRLGDTLQLGGREFTIAGEIGAEPDRVDFGLTFGPRVFASMEAIEQTTLVQKGSRVEHRTLLALPEGAPTDRLRRLAEMLRDELPPYYRVETYRDAQPALRSGLRRVERFLGLVALLSLLVGGVGVAQTVRAWIAGRLDGIAVLKCLGARPREVVALYLGQAALLGLAGSLVGLVVGTGLQLVLPQLFPDLIPPDVIRVFQPGAWLRGLGLGVGVAVLFSAPPLVTVWSVPPALVLRRDAEPLPGARPAWAAVAVALAAGLYLMAWFQSRSPILAAQFLGGVAVVTLALAGAAWVLGRLAHRAPDGAPVWLRHGISAVARPGAATLSAVVALGLGVLVVLSMYLVERQLVRELTAQLPANAPSAFLVDIQPSQWGPVEKLLVEQGAEDLQSVPVVTARIAAIDGVETDTLMERAGKDRRARRWALSREQRLTYVQELPADNEIVAGELWGYDDMDEVSVEADFADDLGVELGSVLTFNVQGVPVDLVVTSLRTVDWGTFGLNFFLVAEPGTLDDAPQQRVATAVLEARREQPIQDALARAYSNITFLKVREILGRIVAVMSKVGLGVRLLGLFTVIAGLVILAGVVSASAVQRGREVALLKTLGMTRRGVSSLFAVEYAMVGLAAGTLGAIGGTVLAWGVLTRTMEASFTFEWGPLLGTIAGSVLLTVTAGLAASASARRRPPIEVLRG